MGTFDVFTELGKQLNVTAEEIKQKWENVNINAVNNAAEKLKQFYIANSGSSTLNDPKNMIDKTYYQKGQYYIRTIDWDDKIPVNVLKGKSYGRDVNKPRERRKRNYSLNPATSHDLAYIISVGRGGKVGNRFIVRGQRAIRKWKEKRDREFETELNKLGKNFE